MAGYQFRIDGISIVSGQATIRITQGASPIPATWQGETIHTTKQEVLDSLNKTDDLLKTLLRDALIIVWKKNDANLNSPNLVVGKTATLDFQNDGLSVTVA